MASGTFLYVAVLDILAEEFENPASWRKRYVALLRLLSSPPSFYITPRLCCPPSLLSRNELLCGTERNDRISNNCMLPILLLGYHRYCLFLVVLLGIALISLVLFWNFL